MDSGSGGTLTKQRYGLPRCSGVRGCSCQLWYSMSHPGCEGMLTTSCRIGISWEYRRLSRVEKVCRQGIGIGIGIGSSLLDEREQVDKQQ